MEVNPTLKSWISLGILNGWDFSGGPLLLGLVLLVGGLLAYAALQCISSLLQGPSAAYILALACVVAGTSWCARRPGGGEGAPRPTESDDTQLAIANPTAHQDLVQAVANLMPTLEEKDAHALAGALMAEPKCVSYVSQVLSIKKVLGMVAVCRAFLKGKLAVPRFKEFADHLDTLEMSSKQMGYVVVDEIKACQEASSDDVWKDLQDGMASRLDTKTENKLKRHGFVMGRICNRAQLTAQEEMALAKKNGEKLVMLLQERLPVLRKEVGRVDPQQLQEAEHDASRIYKALLTSSEGGSDLGKVHSLLAEAAGVRERIDKMEQDAELTARQKDSALVHEVRAVQELADRREQKHYTTESLQSAMNKLEADRVEAEAEAKKTEKNLQDWTWQNCGISEWWGLYKNDIALAEKKLPELRARIERITAEHAEKSALIASGMLSVETSAVQADATRVKLEIEAAEKKLSNLQEGDGSIVDDDDAVEVVAKCRGIKGLQGKERELLKAAEQLIKQSGHSDREDMVLTANVITKMKDVSSLHALKARSKCHPGVEHFRALIDRLKDEVDETDYASLQLVAVAKMRKRLKGEVKGSAFAKMVRVLDADKVGENILCNTYEQIVAAGAIAPPVHRNVGALPNVVSSVPAAFALQS